MFKFQYKSEAELIKEQEEKQILAAEGVADFSIVKVDEKISENGNPMLSLRLRVWDSEGKEAVILDAITNTAAWKISQLCKAIDQEGLYKQSEFDPTVLIEEGGKLKIKHEVYKGKKRAKVVEYLLPTKKQDKTVEIEEDDLPYM